MTIGLHPHVKKFEIWPTVTDSDGVVYPKPSHDYYLLCYYPSRSLGYYVASPPSHRLMSGDLVHSRFVVKFSNVVQPIASFQINHGDDWRDVFSQACHFVDKRNSGIK